MAAPLPAGQGEFLLYQTEDAQTRVQVRFEAGDVWLTQQQLADLYQSSPQNITQHIRAIYQTGELQEAATCKPYLQVRQERGRQVSRSLKHYNLEVALAIGYRAKSHRGTQFRRWATEQLKTYLRKGVLLDDERFKHGDDAEYFEELLVPKGEVTTGFRSFSLDVSQLRLQPGEREIVGQMLRTNEQFTLAAEIGLKEQRPEDYIVHALVDFDDIDYFTHADLLYDLAGQMVRHLRSYLSESEAVGVLDRDRRLIAREIHAQMMAHFFEEATEFEVQVSRGFTELKPCNYTATAGQAPRHFRETVEDVGRIKQMLFGGFLRCLYPLQKFDSDTERRFAVILERDASKWFKPAKGQFQIYYKLGTEQPEYVPDFVVEMDAFILLAETKKRDDLKSDEVVAKAAAAVRWCKYASDHARNVGGKPWKYTLVPHDEIAESKRLADFLRFEVKA